MPALLTIVNNGNGDNTGARWRAGEAVNNLEGHVFGWKEMPKRTAPARTVAEVNSMDLSTQDPYLVIEVTDSGTITDGYTLNGKEPMDVVAGDALVVQFDEVDKFWTNFGSRPQAEYTEKLSMHWRVSDKTPAEMEAYMQPHNKQIDMEVTAGPDPSGFRRVTITNLLVTASGENSWQQENIDSFVAEWNDRYPTCNLQEYQPSTASEVFVEGTFTTGQAVEFHQVVVDWGISDLYARRRWYITQQGMDALSNNDGFMSTTAQELGQVFRDGTLD